MNFILLSLVERVHSCNEVFIQGMNLIFFFFFFAIQHFFTIENKTKKSLFYWSSFFSKKIINALQKLFPIQKHLIIIIWIILYINSRAVLFTKKIDEPISWAMTINMQLFKTNLAHFIDIYFFSSYNIIERTLTQTQMLYTWRNTVPQQHTTWRIICFIPMPCTMQHIVNRLDRSF